MKNKTSPWLMGVLAGTIVLGTLWHGWPSDETKPPTAATPGPRFSFPDRIKNYSGKRVTNVVSIAELEIDGGLEIAGLVINGEPRAYLLDGMTKEDSHLAHDQVGGESVSVAYCNRLSTARCVAIPQAKQEELIVTGWVNDTVQLAFQTNHFSIEAESLPLPELELINTSVDEWRKRYPNSKVYVGNFLEVLKEASRRAPLPARYSTAPPRTSPSS